MEFFFLNVFFRYTDNIPIWAIVLKEKVFTSFNSEFEMWPLSTFLTLSRLHWFPELSVFKGRKWTTPIGSGQYLLFLLIAIDEGQEWTGGMILESRIFLWTGFSFLTCQSNHPAPQVCQPGCQKQKVFPIPACSLAFSLGNSLLCKWPT